MNESEDWWLEEGEVFESPLFPQATKRNRMFASAARFAQNQDEQTQTASEHFSVYVPRELLWLLIGVGALFEAFGFVCFFALHAPLGILLFLCGASAVLVLIGIVAMSWRYEVDEEGFCDCYGPFRRRKRLWSDIRKVAVYRHPYDGTCALLFYTDKRIVADCSTYMVGYRAMGYAAKRHGIPFEKAKKSYLKDYISASKD